MSESTSPRPAMTRDHLLHAYVMMLFRIEEKTEKNIDRAYLLDLINEVAQALDGERTSAAPPAAGATDTRSSVFGRPRNRP